MRKNLFSDMMTAPRDGTLLEVQHGPRQEIVLARWSGQGQAFVRSDDPDRKALHQVTGWRPAPAGAGVADLARPVLQMIQPAVPAVPPLSVIVHARKPRPKR